MTRHLLTELAEFQQKLKVEKLSVMPMCNTLHN